MKSLLLFLLLISFSSSGYYSLHCYPEEITAINGYKIESSGEFKNNIEIIYSDKLNIFGVSLYDYKNKEDRISLDDINFIARGCSLYSSGRMDGTKVITNFENFLIFKKLFNSCDNIFIRLSKSDQYATYKIENEP